MSPHILFVRALTLLHWAWYIFSMATVCWKCSWNVISDYCFICWHCFIVLHVALVLLLNQQHSICIERRIKPIIKALKRSLRISHWSFSSLFFSFRRFICVSLSSTFDAIIFVFRVAHFSQSQFKYICSIFFKTANCSNKPPFNSSVQCNLCDKWQTHLRSIPFLITCIHGFFAQRVIGY